MRASRGTTLAAMSLMAVLATHAAAQDAAAGKTVFAAQCSACHASGDGIGIGPGLKGIEGRKAGSMAGFRYSTAMSTAGYAWDARTLDAFVAAPAKAMPGSAMPYPGLADAHQRADLIAYLQTLK